jgi:topoisomerase IA-like protein
METFYIQDNDDFREATAEEAKQIVKDRLALAQAKKEAEDREASAQAARQSALAKLAALGLTEAEIAAL